MEQDKNIIKEKAGKQPFGKTVIMRPLFALDEHMVKCMAYIDMNMVRAGLRNGLFVVTTRYKIRVKDTH